MNFFARLFKPTSPTTLLECPRCLGKGHVDHDDIKRLEQQLKWIPGKCAYCNGQGKVPEDMISSVPANETFLTNNLSEAERNRVINRDRNTLNRMQQRDATADRMIRQIRELHFTEGLSAEEIAEVLYRKSYRMSNMGKVAEEQRKGLVEYIKKVIYQED